MGIPRHAIGLHAAIRLPHPAPDPVSASESPLLFGVKSGVYPIPPVLFSMLSGVPSTINDTAICGWNDRGDPSRRGYPPYE